MGGETTEMSETTTHVLIEAAHWDAVSMFRTGRRHKLTSEAGKRNERGVDPTICEAAADRVAELLAKYGGGTVEPGVTVVGDAARAAHGHDPDRPARRGSPGWTSPRTRPSRNLEAVGCTVEAARRHADRHRAALAARPHRPVRPRRGGRPDRRLRGRAERAAHRPPGSRSHPGAVDAPPRRSHAGRGGLRRGAQLPVHRGGRPRPARAGRRRPTSYDAAAGQPAQQRRTADDHHAAARPAPHGRAQRQPRHRATWRCSRPRRSPCRTRASAHRSCRSTGRPTEGEWDDLNKALPDQPLHLAFAVCGDRDRAGWWGDGPRGRLERRHRDGPRGRRRARPRADRAAAAAGALAPRPLRRAARRRDRRRPRRRAAPEGVPGLRRARPHVGGRARPRRAARPGRASRPRRRSSRPTRSPRRTSPSWSPPTCRPRSSRRRCARGPARCASRCGSSTSTPGRRSARATSRSRSRCGSGRRTARSPRRRPRRRGTRRWRWRRSGTARRAATRLTCLRSGSGAARAPPTARAISADRAVGRRRAAGPLQGRAEPFAGVLGQRRDVPRRRTLPTEER